MQSLHQDQLYEVLNNTRYEDISYLCRINKNFAQFCRSPRGIELIKELKYKYLINQIINKIKSPIHFLNTLGRFSDNNIILLKDYYSILQNMVIDLLNKDEQLLNILINSIHLRNFDSSQPNKLENFLNLYKDYTGKYYINDIIHILTTHEELIPILDNVILNAIRKFLFKHPEILLPLLNYLNQH